MCHLANAKPASLSRFQLKNSRDTLGEDRRLLLHFHSLAAIHRTPHGANPPDLVSVLFSTAKHVLLADGCTRDARRMPAEYGATPDNLFVFVVRLTEFPFSDCNY